MSKSPLSSRPPVPSDRDKAAARFIEGSDARLRPRAPGEQVYPWQEPHVREDVKKLLSVRLPEPFMLKLQYVAKRSGMSMNQLAVDAITEAVEAKLSGL